MADLGCGDAKIAHSLPAGRVHSFDLVSVNDKVTACDIANVPLSDNAVDAVCARGREREGEREGERERGRHASAS